MGMSLVCVWYERMCECLCMLYRTEMIKHSDGERWIMCTVSACDDCWYVCTKQKQKTKRIAWSKCAPHADAGMLYSALLCYALLCSALLCCAPCAAAAAAACCLLGAQSPTYQQMSSPVEVVWSTMIGCFICYSACTITIIHTHIVAALPRPGVGTHWFPLHWRFTMCSCTARYFMVHTQENVAHNINLKLELSCTWLFRTLDGKWNEILGKTDSFEMLPSFIVKCLTE